MFTATDKSIFPAGVEITPTVINLGRQRNISVNVTVSNLTSQTVVIPPSATLCALHDVQRLGREDLDQAVFKPEQDYEDVAIDFTNTEKNLTTDQFKEVKQVLQKWDSIFSKNDLDLGHTTAVKHKIHLTDEEPVKQRFRRIPPTMFKELQQHLKQMLDIGVIRESHSPWASNIVPVRKKDGKIRFCIDFRQLNKRTVKDAYAIPRMEDTLDLLHGKMWYSCVDLKTGYWQVEMQEEDKACTAFTVGPLGLYECNRLPFGLTNAPATFQRMMENVLGDLNMTVALVYLDDIIIFSNSFQEHIQHIEAVFGRIRKFGLKLNPSKCSFFQTRIKYLGHIVSREGLEVDTSKTETLKTWPTPSSVKELRTFLGFTGYFRRFIKDYAKTAKPLNDLLVGNGGRSNRRREKSKHTTIWNWGQEQQKAFTALIEKLTSPPILAFPDYTRSFTLHIDASNKGLGAVLYQQHDDKERVIAYASRGLMNTEKNYAAHKLEFLSLKWAVTDRFYDLLYGNKFEVITDNNPLTYVLSSAKLDATGHRWLASLAVFDFTIKYRPGKKNQDADALSRLPHGSEYLVVTPEMITAIGQSHKEDVSLVETTAMNIHVVDSIPQEVESVDNFGYRRWRDLQRNDLVINEVVQVLLGNTHASSKQNSESKTLLKDRNKLFLKRGVLYRKRTENDGEVHQLILPLEFHNQVMKGLHDDIGHPGVDRTLGLIRQRFYWSTMTKDVTEYVNKCKNCILRKGRVSTAPLVNISTSQPLELVCIDYLSIEPSKGGIENVLVVTDHFTRYAQAYPTPNQTAKTTAKVLFENFILHYGFPLQLHSDQGRNFESEVIQHLCKFANITKTHTSPYHPMGNGMCERFNRSLLGMLGTLSEDQKKDWKSYISPLVHAYNSIKHESTGFTPFYLMFGRHPRLPIDAMLGLPEDSQNDITYTNYIESLKDKLRYTYKLASTKADQSRQRQKQSYDKRVRQSVIDIGDRVLIKRTGFTGKHKLANKWENVPYVVVDQPNKDIPVYRLKEEGGVTEKILHRNLLLPIGSIPIQEPKSETKKSTRKSETNCAGAEF